MDYPVKLQIWHQYFTSMIVADDPVLKCDLPLLSAVNYKNFVESLIMSTGFSRQQAYYQANCKNNHVASGWRKKIVAAITDECIAMFCKLCSIHQQGSLTSESASYWERKTQLFGNNACLTFRWKMHSSNNVRFTKVTCSFQIAYFMLRCSWNHDM